MIPLALARRFRPKTFSEVVGQSHVVKALQNSIARGNAHHAYLFSGTRGVGKTTLARILAKSLNCLSNNTAPEPCNRCTACLAIDEGRFFDVLELDAASHTGVDNMREILSSTNFAPVVGKNKVYIIDEAHMLSKAAFNAMLKTLEEPSAHTTFVLATTEAEKIPATIRSRCLQFNLRRLASDAIVLQLQQILAQEKIAADDIALKLLAENADGSLRDALSLLDQAIAYGNASVSLESVETMLGIGHKNTLDALLLALAEENGQKLLQCAESLDALGCNWGSILDQIARALAEATKVQLQLAAAANPVIERLAGHAPETIQLWYQITAYGRRDLPYAPSEFIGATMTLLRMLAFTLEDVPGHAITSPKTKAPATSAPLITPEKSPGKPAIEKLNESSWLKMIQSLSLTGRSAVLAHQLALRQDQGDVILCVAPSSFSAYITKASIEMLGKAISEKLGRNIQLDVQIGEGKSLAVHEKEEQQKLQQLAHEDPMLQEIQNRFSAEIIDMRRKGENI
jgi:DNA polymerase-3 subunit gamma/tau